MYDLEFASYEFEVKCRNYLRQTRLRGRKTYKYKPYFLQVLKLIFRF